MKHKIFLLCFSIALSLVGIAQDKFDIARFVAPKGWQRIDSNGIVLLQHSKTENGLTSFCQMFLYPSRPSDQSAEKNFADEWNGRVAGPTGSKEAPAIESEKKPEGWTVVSGHANITQQGITYTCMLVSISGFGKVMSVMFNLAGENYLAAVEKFLNDLDLDSKATGSPEQTPIKSTGKGSITLEDYSYTAPARWFRQNSPGYILLSQYQTLEYGCLISIFPSQPSSGNLEADAKNIFEQMYPGWQLRYTGEKQYDISMGHTPQGFEYCMMEANMHKMRPDGYYYDYENGSALVIKAGSDIVIITGRHNRGEMSCFCKHQYEYWGKFFNSFTIKNQPASKITEKDISKRIVGVWEAMGGNALNKYILAANGNYQFIGAYSTTTKTTDAYYEYTNISTSGFKGDGRYSVRGDLLLFSKHNGTASDQVKFRFEKVNHGGKGWKDRLYMLQVSREDGKEFEVCYEKE